MRRSILDGLRSNEIRALFAYADGGVWLATPLGGSRWQNDVVEHFNIPQQIVRCLQDTSGRLWAGGAGLFRFDGAG